MPLFECAQCGCVDNTALANFWTNDMDHPLCSWCDPDIEHWHGQFPRRKVADYEAELGEGAVRFKMGRNFPAPPPAEVQE